MHIMHKFHLHQQNNVNDLRIIIYILCTRNTIVHNIPMSMDGSRDEQYSICGKTRGGSAKHF